MFRRENGEKFIPFCIPQLIPDLYDAYSDELLLSAIYIAIDIAILCARNKTFDLGPLSHCFIYCLGARDLSIYELVGEEKGFMSCKQTVWEMWYIFSFLYF